MAIPPSCCRAAKSRLPNATSRTSLAVAIDVAESDGNVLPAGDAGIWVEVTSVNTMFLLLASRIRRPRRVRNRLFSLSEPDQPLLAHVAHAADSIALPLDRLVIGEAGVFEAAALR